MPSRHFPHKFLKISWWYFISRYWFPSLVFDFEGFPYKNFLYQIVLAFISELLYFSSFIFIIAAAAFSFSFSGAFLPWPQLSFLSRHWRFWCMILDDFSFWRYYFIYLFHGYRRIIGHTKLPLYRFPHSSFILIELYLIIGSRELFASLSLSRLYMFLFLYIYSLIIFDIFLIEASYFPLLPIKCTFWFSRALYIGSVRRLCFDTFLVSVSFSVVGHGHLCICILVFTYSLLFHFSRFRISLSFRFSICLNDFSGLFHIISRYQALSSLFGFSGNFFLFSTLFTIFL